MAWRRIGHIFDPAAHPEWAHSHAQVPTALVLSDVIRVYYADRDVDGKSYTTFVDLDREDPMAIRYFHKLPILDRGAPGTFDDDGIMPSYVMREGNRVLLYYSGWNRGVTVPYRNSIGVAISEDDGRTFERLFDGPIMDRNAREPHIAVTPSIIREDGRWRMWYISGLRWVEIDGKMEPVYVIKYAHSSNGIDWTRPNHLCIPQRHDLEAFSHPTVLKIGGEYRMWYCFRDSRDYRDGAGAYRIGYATSIDGLGWERKDHAGGLDVSPSGWDSTMTSYPYAFELDGRVFMLYNGNGFGRTGFGLAQWEDATGE